MAHSSERLVEHTLDDDPVVGYSFGDIVVDADAPVSGLRSLAPDLNAADAFKRVARSLTPVP